MKVKVGRIPAIASGEGIRFEHLLACNRMLTPRLQIDCDAVPYPCVLTRVVLECRSIGGAVAEEAFMRAIPMVTMTFAVLSLSTIAAHAGTWCAQYGGRNGGTNCGFHSFAQCQAARSGNGGFCRPNTFAAGSAYGYATGPRRHYRRY